MRSVVVALLLLSGCDALFNLDHVSLRDGGGAASDADGATDDAVIDADTQNICMGTGRGFHSKFCYPVGTTFAASFAPTAPIDTDTMCDEIVAQTNTTGICIKKAISINIAIPIRVTGGRPLVLLASDKIDVSGTLDASSNRGGANGAGANTGETTVACGVLYINGDPGGSSTGGGGGAGGTFHGAGGNGGNGSTTNGGTARPAENPTKIHGGCKGGSGGSGNGNVAAGTPGAAGGGAIYLAATNAITVTGSIKVNGAGGLGGAAFYGGSGGGAGGMIVLDAPTVTLGAVTSLLAVGGGGGQGGDSVGPGANGTDGPVSTGGLQGTSGGAGGAGSDVNAIGGSSGTIAGGGGGGGGGYILIASPAATIVVNGMLRPNPLVQ